MQALQGQASLLRACGEYGCAYPPTSVNVYTVCYHGHMCMCKHAHLYRSALQLLSVCRPRAASHAHYHRQPCAATDTYGFNNSMEYRQISFRCTRSAVLVHLVGVSTGCECQPGKPAEKCSCTDCKCGTAARGSTFIILYKREIIMSIISY